MENCRHLFISISALINSLQTHGYYLRVETRDIISLFLPAITNESPVSIHDDCQEIFLDPWNEIAVYHGRRSALASLQMIRFQRLYSFTCLR